MTEAVHVLPFGRPLLTAGEVERRCADVLRSQRRMLARDPLGGRLVLIDLAKARGVDLIEIARQLNVLGEHEMVSGEW